MSNSKCQTVFLAVHNTIWGWWYKTMANFHWIRSSPMDSQCKCHSGGTNIFRFYDKHKCIINLDLARNTELAPNIHMSYSEKRWKNSNACQYLSTNNLNELPITFMYYPFMGNLYWGLLTNAYHQDSMWLLWSSLSAPTNQIFRWCQLCGSFWTFGNASLFRLPW